MLPSGSNFFLFSSAIFYSRASADFWSADHMAIILLKSVTTKTHGPEIGSAATTERRCRLQTTRLRKPKGQQQTSNVNTFCMTHGWTVLIFKEDLAHFLCESRRNLLQPKECRRHLYSVRASCILHNWRYPPPSSDFLKIF